MKTYYIKYSIPKKIKEITKKFNLDNINYVKFYDFTKEQEF